MLKDHYHTRASPNTSLPTWIGVPAFWWPDRLAVSAWYEHIPFAFWVIDALRPRVFVELGVHEGVSYCAFCQAIDRLCYSAQAFGIDHWRGDEHAGVFDESVLRGLADYHDPKYGRFSRLVRSDFDGATGHFNGESIDLLHIDGFHTYEAVKHDFETWLPKLSGRSVVLFHDVNVREGNFGVARFFCEVAAGRRHFIFEHGHGLGVLEIGAERSERLAPLFDASEDEAEAQSVRAVFARLGSGISQHVSADHWHAQQSALTASHGRVNTLAEELVDRDRRLAELRESLSDVAVEHAARVRALSEHMASEIAACQDRASNELKFLIESRDVDTQSYSTKINEFQAEVSDLAVRLLRSEAMSAELEAKLNSARADADLLSAKLRSQETFAHNLVVKLQGATTLTEEIRSKLNDREGQLEDIRRSLSWRLLRPLQAVSRVFTRQGIHSTSFQRTQLRLVAAWRHPFNSHKRKIYRRRRLDRKAKLDALRDIVRTLADSGLFDGQWYATAHPDIAAAGMDPLWHFVDFGAAEMRRASPLFDTRWYLDSYPDVAASGVNPLFHYLRWGAKEGRDPNPFFDTDWYVAQYQDVAAAGVNPLAHYKEFGAAEGRRPSSQFDPTAYCAHHPEFSGGPARALEEFLREQAELDLRSLIAPIGDSMAVLNEASASGFEYRPLVSVITPVFDVAEKWLRRAVSSVQSQTYSHWQMCVGDDCSTRAETVAALAELGRGEPRLRIARLEQKTGIAAATNAALSLATGEFVAFLDNDDELAPHALAACVAALNQDRDIDVLYSDEDKLNGEGRREEPFLKPDWSPAFLREVMYVGHLLFVRRSLIEKVGRLDSAYDGVQDYDLMLRISEQTRKIHHIRDILYHWRRIPGSVADAIDAKPGLTEKQAKAVNSQLQRLGAKAHAEPRPGFHHRVRVVPTKRADYPCISIVIPSRDAPEHIERCLGSLYGKTSYPHFEVLVVDNRTTDARALSTLANHPIKRVQFDERFNFSQANNLGVSASNGSVLVLLNNDTEVVQGDWLEQMLFLLDDPEVAAVGPMLLYPDRTVQHAGVALGIRGTADHVLRGLPPDADGYFGSLACTREVSAVTFACVMMRRADYGAVGGLQEMFATHYQDVDFCLRLRERRRRILYTPHARLIHHESATRGSRYDVMDRALLLDRWGSIISEGDPYARWEPATRGQTKYTGSLGV